MSHQIIFRTNQAFTFVERLVEQTLQFTSAKLLVMITITMTFVVMVIMMIALIMMIVLIMMITLIMMIVAIV